MRQRIVSQLTRSTADSEALDPVRRTGFLVYLMGPYRTFDPSSLVSEDADVEEVTPSFATWDDSASECDESEVLALLERTRDCLRDRGFNAFLAIDVGIDLDEMDAATQSIEFARASNAVVFVAPQVGDNLGVGIEIGSVFEDIFASAGADERPARSRRTMIAAEPDVRSAMLGAVHSRWDASVRTFTDGDDLCRLCAQFCTHIENEERYGDLEPVSETDE